MLPKLEFAVQKTNPIIENGIKIPNDIAYEKDMLKSIIKMCSPLKNKPSWYSTMLGSQIEKPETENITKQANENKSKITLYL